MCTHAPTPINFRHVQGPCPLWGRIVPHLLERPDEVDGGRARLREHAARDLQVLPELRCERVAVRGRDPDRRRAAHCEYADRLGDLGGALAPELDLLVRKPALIQQDDSAGFETEDALGG